MSYEPQPGAIAFRGGASPRPSLATPSAESPDRSTTSPNGGHFRCARWGDGSLTIETEEQTLQFTPEQARQIRALWEVAA